MTSDYYDIRIGMKVLTLKNSLTPERERSNYDPAARKCLWGAKGIVVDVSDAHGLCFKVKHGLRSYAWYERSEIERVSVLDTTVTGKLRFYMWHLPKYFGGSDTLVGVLAMSLEDARKKISKINDIPAAELETDLCRVFDETTTFQLHIRE